MIINPTFPYGVVTFCDDIRHEVTGKMTLVGVYHSHLDVVGESPEPLINLNVLVDFRFIRGSLSSDPVFKVFRSDIEDAIIETTAERPNPGDLQPADLESVEPDSILFDQFVFPIQMNGMIIRQSCKLKVRAFVNNDEYRLGALWINLWSPEQFPD
jgi:hypothetical protein